jgi:iron complex outermembrane receptor protein
MVRIDRPRQLGAAAALLPLLVAVSTHAQEAPASAPPAPAAASVQSNDDGKIAEVVVTAQRREEKLQEVPLAVTAMGAEQIENRGIQNVSDLSALAPGLQISKTASNSTISQITIRGLSQINPAIYWDPAVGIYIDGVYLGKAQGSVFDVVDLQRVEVLRGPQGTLYGRNTLAGAINLITRKPSGEFGGSASIEVGNFDALTTKASVDLPKMGIFSVSIAARQEQRGGWVHTSRDSSTGELNDRNGNGMRLAVDMDFAPTVLGQYRFDYSRVDQMPNWDQLYRADPGFFAFVGYPDQPSYASHERLEHANLDAPMFEKSRVMGHAFTLSWDVNENNQLKSITGYRTLDWDDSLDLDGSPNDVAFTQRFTNYNQFSQDLQWLGHTEKLNWVGGLYYFGDDGDTDNPQHFFSHFANYDSRYGTKTHAYSGYGQIDYKPIDPLTLSAGVRYTSEKKELTRTFGFVGSDPYLIPEGTSASKTFDATTPMASIAWQFTPDVNTYFRYAQGFKSGGFNGEYSNVNQTSVENIEETKRPFKPEKQTSYELGTKTMWFEQRVQLNAALYYNKAKDLQESVFLGGDAGAAASSVRNAGKATIYGAELEGQVALWAGSRLGFNYAYLHTKYDEFIDTDPVTGLPINVADNRAFVHAPKNTANVYLDLRLAKLSFGELRGLVDYSYTAAFYTYAYQLSGPGDAGYDPSKQVAGDSQVPSTSLLNLRLSLANVKLGGTATGELALWCRNVTDEDAPTNFIDFGPSFGSLTVANFNDPRTYGLTGTVRW